jgi:hypothetical protein
MESKEIVINTDNEKKKDFKPEDVIEILNGNTEKSIDPVKDFMSYIRLQLSDGLHPSFLEKEEKYFLSSNLGEDWYKEWGYVKEDLDDIVTLKR